MEGSPFFVYLSLSYYMGQLQTAVLSDVLKNYGAVNTGQASVTSDSCILGKIIRIAGITEEGGAASFLLMDFTKI